MQPTSARAWLDLVLDTGWAEVDFDDVVSTDPLRFPGYAEQLAAARERTGCTESVVVADGTIGGTRALVISFEFGFLGGSMGMATGERICRTFERGASDGVPVIALTASGGARMQEGMYALAQMPATVAARDALGRANQPFIAYLRDPTTGGVFASFASTADLVLAEPGATIGFAGPRVAESVTGTALPAGSHTAESAHAACLVDSIVEPAVLRERLARALDLLDRRSVTEDGAPIATTAARLDAEGLDADGLDAMRDPTRPSGRAYVHDLEPIRRGGGEDATLVAGLTRLAGRTVMAIAHDRSAGAGRQTPAAFRRARTAIEVASRLAVPIVTFVDTPGAEPGADAERDGIAREIALTFDALLRAPVPTVACVVGEGGSGGALALAATDEVLMLRNAMFSVIAPEGAAAILRRDDVRSIVDDLRLREHAFPRAHGDDVTIVPEPDGGAQADPAVARELLEGALRTAFDRLAGGPTDRRITRWRMR